VANLPFLSTFMKLRRRHFLQQLGWGAVALGAGRGAAAGAAPAGGRRLERIGVIGGVPKDAGADWRGSLRRMAECGYAELESGRRGDSTPEFLRFVQEIGLKLVACGVKLGKTLPPDWLDQATDLKASYAVCYWPWFHPLERLTLGQLKEIADRLNACGEQCQRAGLKLAVHNHDRDFALLEGRPIFERLIELTDPRLVAVQLDLYWIIKAGFDPVDYFRRYPGRFELVHVKDMGPPPARGFAAVGAGTINFGRIFAHATLAGVKHTIVELEQEAATTPNFVASCRHLQQLRF
jgi:sugar phosphate isomerase/epimerase